MVYHAKLDSGFSLVEVSLAILVVAVGLLSVIALFPSGLQASRRAVDETRGALFSEEVFNGFRAIAGFHPWDLIDDYPNLAPPGIDIFTAPRPLSPDALKLKPNTPGAPHLNRYVYKPGYRPGEITAYAVRYDLRIQEDPARPNIKYMWLKVWNGEFGPDDEYTLYYTELYNTGIN